MAGQGRGLIRAGARPAARKCVGDTRMGTPHRFRRPVRRLDRGWRPPRRVRARRTFTGLPPDNRICWYEVPAGRRAGGMSGRQSSPRRPNRCASSPRTATRPDSPCFSSPPMGTEQSAERGLAQHDLDTGEVQVRVAVGRRFTRRPEPNVLERIVHHQRVVRLGFGARVEDGIVSPSCPRTVRALGHGHADVAQGALNVKGFGR